MNGVCALNSLWFRGLAGLWLTLAAQPVAAESWSSFQNGGRLSVQPEVAPRSEWSADQGIAWDVPLAGYGQSSPVVDGQTIYVTSTSGANKEQLHIQAFDRASGKELWRYDGKNSTPQESSNYISKAAPTPVCDAAGVVAFFEGGNLIALTKTGELRWERDLVADLGPIAGRHGLASSLEQDDQHIFVWVERAENPYLLAVSKSNGQTAWKVDGLGVTSWATPRLVPVGDQQHLVLSGVGQLVGIDPANGQRLWTFKEIAGNSTPTPIPLGEGRFLIGATDGRGEAAGGNAAASNGVVQISQLADGTWQAAYVWHAKRATSSFGSPLAHQGLAYFVNRTGVLYCLDVNTGEEKYAQRIDGSIWATPVGVGDRIYFFGKDGKTTVIAAGPEFQKLSSSPLWEAAKAEGEFGGPVLYAAVLVDADLILRRGDRLYRIAP